MNYCERCKNLTKNEECSVCGNEVLREPTDEDFCFVGEFNSMSGEMIRDMLSDDGIACALIPSGNGVRSVFAMRLENFRVYVPYGWYDHTVDMINEYILGNVNDAESDLKNNVDKLNYNSRFERKWKKRAKLTQEDDLLEFCKNKVLSAERIVDSGATDTFSEAGGNYLFVYCDTVKLTINSVTYEVLALEAVKK